MGAVGRPHQGRTHVREVRTTCPSNLTPVH